MAIYYKHKEISSLKLSDKVIAYVYYGGKLIWQSIVSCFAKGFWINEQPWSDTSAWKN